jgi:trigger factor
MVPGFEDEIIGMEVGSEKEFDITFPKDYHAKEMQDKKVHFKLTLNRLEEKKEQKLDETLIEKITGQKQSVKDFKERVESDLIAELQMRSQQEHDSKVVQEIIKITKVDIPEALIEQEIEFLKNEQKQRITQQGLTWEQYLQHINKKEEDFAKDHQKPAEERITARLGVNYILKDAKIEVTDDEVGKKLNEVIAKYPEAQQAHVREQYKKDSDGYRNLKNNMAADKLIDMLSK